MMFRGGLTMIVMMLMAAIAIVQAVIIPVKHGGGKSRMAEHDPASYNRILPSTN